MAIQDTGALLRLRRGLKDHFGPGAAVFVDPLLWLIGCVSVDIVRLDEWLMRRNPDYGEDESMSDFIRRKYGQKAERFVKHFFPRRGPSDGRKRGKPDRKPFR